MTEWLFKDENYVPIKDNDKFIDKSIFAFLNLLSNIRTMNRYKERNFIYSINPILKFILTLTSIVLVALSRSFVFAAEVLALSFILCWFIDSGQRKKVYILNLVLPIFTLIMLTPSILMGNYKNSLLIVIKAAATIAALNILSYTTKWHHLTKAFKLIFIPDIFIFVMDITIKYIYVLGEYSLEMLYALKLRSVGKNERKNSSAAKLMGNLFLKSKEAGEEMYSAMECRGFTGEYEVYRNFRFKKEDIIYSMLYLLLTASYFFK